MMYLISDGGLNSNIPDTMEAVLLTKNLNYLDGVKIDVHKSIDNIFVLAKDNDLSQFTYSKGKVNESNYHYLKKVKFPSHIFKYYIPTLEEVLKKYDKQKIIALELYEKDNLKILYDILLKYHYQYYFISKNKDILNELSNLNFSNLGKIINESSNITLIKNNDNTFLIIEK